MFFSPFVSGIILIYIFNYLFNVAFVLLLLLPSCVHGLLFSPGLCCRRWRDCRGALLISPNSRSIHTRCLWILLKKVIYMYNSLLITDSLHSLLRPSLLSTHRALSLLSPVASFDPVKHLHPADAALDSDAAVGSIVSRIRCYGRLESKTDQRL